MRVVLLLGLLFGFQAAHAQAKGKSKGSNHRQVATQTSVQGQLQSRSSYQARSGEAPLRIADPTINALNRQGSGGSVKLYGSNGVLGIPRGTYGYGNGQLWLRSTDATSIGGTTGMSTVGTGSSSAGVGVSGSVLGVNGKAPNAGPTIWGSARGLLNQRPPLWPSAPVGEKVNQ